MPTQPIYDALAIFFQAFSPYYPGGFAEFVRQFYSFLFGYP
jgi:hypothetical protein